MTLLTLSDTAFYAGPRARDRFYTANGLDLGKWSDIEAFADKDPAAVRELFGLAGPAIIFTYALTPKFMHIGGAHGVELERPSSRLNIKAALQPVQVFREPYLVLAQNGMTDLAKHITLHEQIAYQEDDNRFVGALVPQGDIYRVDGRLGKLGANELEKRLRSSTGLSLSALSYNTRVDEYGIQRLVLPK